MSAAELVGNVDVGSLDVGRSESMNFSLPQNDLPLPEPTMSLKKMLLESYHFLLAPRPILRCKLLVSGGQHIFCGNFLDEQIFREKGMKIIDETHFIWMMTWIGEYFLGEKLQV